MNNLEIVDKNCNILWTIFWGSIKLESIWIFKQFWNWFWSHEAGSPASNHIDPNAQKTGMSNAGECRFYTELYRHSPISPNIKDLRSYTSSFSCWALKDVISSLSSLWFYNTLNFGIRIACIESNKWINLLAWQDRT